MAKFKFRLDFLISLRRRKEEEATTRLAKRLASIRELEGHIRAMENNKGKLNEELSEFSRSGRLNGPLLNLYSDYLARLGQEIKKAEELLFLSRKEEVRERAALVKAMVDRQLIEKIKDNKKTAWKTDQLYQEQNAMEELAALAKARRNHEDDLNVS